MVTRYIKSVYASGRLAATLPNRLRPVSESNLWYGPFFVLVAFLSMFLIGCGNNTDQETEIMPTPAPSHPIMKQITITGVVDSDGKTISVDGGMIEMVARGEFIFTFSEQFTEIPEIKVTTDDSTAAIMIGGLTKDYAKVDIFQLFLPGPYLVTFTITGTQMAPS